MSYMRELESFLTYEMKRDAIDYQKEIDKELEDMKKILEKAFRKDFSELLYLMFTNYIKDNGYDQEIFEALGLDEIHYAVLVDDMPMYKKLYEKKMYDSRDDDSCSYYQERYESNYR